MPLVKGRFFDPTDNADAPGVIIVNEALARRQWPNEDPIGQTVTSPITVIGPMGRSLMKRPQFQVVGVVASVKNSTLVRDAEPAIYFNFRQFPFRGLNIVVQGQGDAAALLGALRTSVQRLDPNLPLASARTIDRIVGEATDRPRALMMLMGIFAALALVLSALGIYSVLSYSVNQRRQELSVRMALGAQPGDVLWLVVRQGLWLALIGGVAGVGRRARGRPGDVEPALRRLVRRRRGLRRRDRARARHRARRVPAARAPRRRARSARGSQGGLRRVRGSWFRGSGFAEPANPEPRTPNEP